ncbi:MAG: glycosyl hydrolase family 18 protein [Candidatus Nanopelagicales bacterium]
MNSRRGRWAIAVAAALVAGLCLPFPAQAAGHSRKVTGWFGYWHTPSEVSAVARRGGRALGEANIFWWEYRGSGNPVCTSTLSCPSSSATPWASSDLLRSARLLQARGVLVYATHTDLDSSLAGSLSDYLAKPDQRRRLAQRLTGWAVRAGVDGVDLDWENFAFNDGASSWRRTRPRLTDTVRRLGKKLHAHGLRLSVTVPGGYEPFTPDGTPRMGGGYTVFDWKALAPSIDRLRLMTYDYSWDRPGPIGPNDWAGRVVRSAVAQVGPANRRKIYVGLHQYGKAWYQRDADDDYITVGKCDDRWVPDESDAVSLTPAEARSAARDYGVRPRFDRASREFTFSYTKTVSGHWYNRKDRRRTRDCEVRKTIWFGGAATAVGRMQLVRRYRIGGIAVWNLASLDGGFFNGVRPFLKVQAQVTPKPKPKSKPKPSHKKRHRR